MKIYVDKDELWPCYSVSKKEGPAEAIADVPEETYRKWRKIANLFFKTQDEIRAAVEKYEYTQGKIKHLRDCFANPTPSRQEKNAMLEKFGWDQIDTSLWEKDGRKLRLHEAYNECKAEFERENPCDGPQ